MKAMLSAVAVMAIIAIAAPLALDRAGYSTADMTSGRNVRLN